MARNHQAYLKIVAKFIATHGPQFQLDELTRGPVRSCDCCGYHPIVNYYHVVNERGDKFIIGSECQEWVLDFIEAHLPAARVRILSADQLVKLGLKYGLVLDENQPQTELASDVISARRRFANISGWVSRRNTVAPSPQQLLSVNP